VRPQGAHPIGSYEAFSNVEAVRWSASNGVNIEHRAAVEQAKGRGEGKRSLCVI